jgi:prepilin-type processing-associated H-X9-DG protein
MHRLTTIAPHTWRYTLYSGRVPPKSQSSFKAHRGQCNRGFLDGHVEVEEMRRPFNPSDEELRRWNIDHQPHRDKLVP